jgi:hypothetical protein
MDQFGSPVQRSTRFALSAEDYVRAQRLNMIRAYQRPRTWLRTLLIIVLVIAVGALVRHSLPDNIPALVLGMAIAVVLRLMFSYFIAVPAGSRKRFFENQSLRRPTIIRWSAEQLELVRDDNKGARLAWKDLADMAESDAVLLFYQTRRTMFIVPKHSLSEMQIADLLNCAAEKSDL